MIKTQFKLKLPIKIVVILIITAVLLACCSFKSAKTPGKNYKSDHFDGEKFFNPERKKLRENNNPEKKRRSWRIFSYWTKGWIFGFDDWPEWPYFTDDQSSIEAQNKKPKPVKHVNNGEIRITPVGHSTFLIQLANINILTDPVWSERASPVSFHGPKRHHLPGIDFDDLPSIDAVLVSHNHYEHLDIPTLEKLSEKGCSLAVTTLGNAALIMGAGFKTVHELDWWNNVRISDKINITVVPAQHFSSRSLWGRNKALWCGFVISYDGGHIYFSGDTGYSKYIKDIRDTFFPIRVSILPISPYRNKSMTLRQGSLHMNPHEAVAAHLNLNSELSIACHYNVFQLGPLEYGEASTALQNELIKRDIDKERFILPELWIPIVIKGIH